MIYPYTALDGSRSFTRKPFLEWRGTNAVFFNPRLGKNPTETIIPFDSLAAGSKYALPIAPHKIDLKEGDPVRLTDTLIINPWLKYDAGKEGVAWRILGAHVYVRWQDGNMFDTSFNLLDKISEGTH